MADLKNRFDRISSNVGAVESVEEIPTSSRPKWILSSFTPPEKNAESIDWEAIRRNKLSSAPAINLLLSSSISHYEDILTALIPGINMEINIMVSSERASELLMKVCSRMNMKITNFERINECYLIKSNITNNGVEVVACYKDKTTQEMNKMIFEESSSPSQQVNL